MLSAALKVLLISESVSFPVTSLYSTLVFENLGGKTESLFLEFEIWKLKASIYSIAIEM